VVVERHVREGIMRQPEDDVAHAVGLGLRQLGKDPSPFDSALVLMRSADRIALRVTSLFCME
jgi:hypothetical protein